MIHLFNNYLVQNPFRRFLNWNILVFLFILCSCSSSKTITNTVPDGSSYEQAIVVKSVIEEYDFVKKACPDCELLGQMLSHYKDKPYDILNMKNSKGEEVSYYFDISKFFGKGF